MSRHEEKPRRDFYREVDKKARRKERARRQRERSLWTSLGVMGVVGWSVAIPTLLGALLGVWLDANWPGPFSWTLTLLVTGLIIGCLGAWQWVSQEMEKIKKSEPEYPEEEQELDDE